MPLPPPQPKSPQAQFQAKMAEIAAKEAERKSATIAAQLGLQFIRLDRFPIAPEALTLVPEEDARRLKLIPIYRTVDEARIATADPTNPDVTTLVQTIGDQFHLKVQLMVTSEEGLAKAWKLYAIVPKIVPLATGVEISAADVEKFEQTIQSFRDLNARMKGVTTTEQVTLIIVGAMRARASDIHVEAEEQDIKIRYRIDGLLQDAAVIPKEAWKQLIARLKLLSGLKLNIADKPQDGRFTIHTKTGVVDVRVSTLPTAYGESVVIRLLMSNVEGFAFNDLGIRGAAFEQLKREVERPNGMIITTGPTGSGKTTTLYAILNKLNQTDTKIITVEDPIEYHLKGINQSQVEASKGYTFAGGLRSILRQDPDVVMVGEIRDLETAETATQAALTGHLVLSTIHTNSAAGTIPRFLSMGAKPFLLAPALNAMIGQRLVRRICPDCKEELVLAPEVLDRAKKILETLSPASGYTVDWNTAKFYHGKGCEKCQALGYKGRIGVYEVLVMSKEIEKMILGGQVSEYDIQDLAIKAGMVSMVQDGLLKAMDGITTVEEVFRVAE